MNEVTNMKITKKKEYSLKRTIYFIFILSILLILLFSSACTSQPQPTATIPAPEGFSSWEEYNQSITTVTSSSPISIISSSNISPNDTNDTSNTTNTKDTITSQNLTVYFFDVGQGDSILLDIGTIEILIDGGDGSTNIVPYLTPLVDGAIEVMIATHPHQDHIGGLEQVLAAFDVTQIWYNGDISTSQTYQRFITAINTENATIHVARKGDIITAGPLSLVVLHPTNLTGSTNNNSIVTKCSFGSVNFLFMGDAEIDAENEILSGNDAQVLKADILKVGHHGSKTSSSPEFLNTVKPKVAIYSAGIGNSYGHPHQETISALTAVGAQIYGTDKNGTIVVTSDCKSFSVQPKITDSPTPPVIVPEPAKFTLRDLSISPNEVKAGEPVTITATVTNSGDSSGNYIAILKINGSQIETKSVSLNAGESQSVSFTIVNELIGNYTVELGSLSSTFTITKVVTPEPEVPFLEIVSVTSPIGQGYTATLKAKTLPRAQCTITVYYKSGASTASGLYTKEADSQGNVSWSWKVGTRTTPGSWRIVVTASLEGKTVSQTTYFTVY
jgi:competence protein ComEC